MPVWMRCKRHWKISGRSSSRSRNNAVGLQQIAAAAAFASCLCGPPAFAILGFYILQVYDTKLKTEQMLEGNNRRMNGKTAKYIFVTGGVLSSLGKGLASASMGALLESRGLTVTIQKLDPYINVDPGTMNPFQHGEVFVTDDGA